ncbi:MAG: hypothetical protein R2867_18375 [Caldilineaceae bacterium]
MTAAIHFNERYYVGTAADGLRVVQPDRHGGYEWYPLHAGADSFASDRVTALANVDGAFGWHSRCRHQHLGSGRPTGGPP